MTNRDGEQLSRYLDKQLSPSERAAFERDLGSRPDLAERLGRWRGNDDRLRAAFDVSVPDELAARLGLTKASVIEFATRRSRPEASGYSARWARVRWLGGGAVAASIAALFAFMLLPAGREVDDPLATSAFQMAMQRLPSGQTLPLSGASVTPRLTFSDSTGRYCREFAFDGSRTQIGIACRSGERWKVEGVAPAIGPGMDSGQIQTAGDRENPAVDALYERLQASDPFDSGEERRLIESGWRGRSEGASK